MCDDWALRGRVGCGRERYRGRRYVFLCAQERKADGGRVVAVLVDGSQSMFSSARPI